MNMLKIILSVILLYIYMHNPLFSILNGSGSIKLLYPLLFLFLGSYYRKCLFFIKDLLFLYILIILYSFFRSSFGGDNIFVYTSVVALIEVVLLGSIITSFFIKNSIPLFRMLLFTGAISVVISMLCLFFPSVNMFIKFKLVVISDYLDSNSYRGFGLSDSLTYSYGIIQGIIFSIYIKNIKQFKWFLFFIPFLLVSILINARTGFLIVISSVLIYSFLNIKKGLIVLFLISLFLSIYSLFDIPLLDEKTEQFVMGFFWELRDIFLGTNLATFSTQDALKNMIVFPETSLQWLFGRGTSLYLGGKDNTDIGFLLQLNYGGILYILLLFFMFFRLLKKIDGLYLLIMSVIILVIANIKGSFIINSGGFRLLFLLIIYKYCLAKTVVMKSKSLNK